MFSKWTILTFTAAFLSTGCFSKATSGKDLELLTGSPWRYGKAGFGNDDDGIFDALDPRIAGSEKENMIIFCKDGTGYSQYEQKNRNGNPNSLPFIWAFQNNNSTIYFQDQYYKVRMLSQKRLEIYADQRFGGVSTRYTIVFIR